MKLTAIDRLTLRRAAKLAKRPARTAAEFQDKAFVLIYIRDHIPIPAKGTKRAAMLWEFLRSVEADAERFA